jgi:MoxR-like ATPase
MENKKELKELVKELDHWEDWQNNYSKFVPLFIEEASKCNNWDTWNQDVFYEFFEKARDQCVSSLQQGYFTNAEKENIKNNWHSIAPLLKELSENQDEPNFELYHRIQDEIRKYTNVNRRAGTYRLIASLQPHLLCTIVNEGKLRSFIRNLNLKATNSNLSLQGSWFNVSNTVIQFFKEQLGVSNTYNIMTLPWELYEYFNANGNSVKNNEMSESEVSEYIELLEYKKQIILQGPPGTGKTREAKLIAKEMISVSDVEELTNHEQFKIVQFHPSYTYEDFVRGIATVPNGNGIEYQVVDKGIAEFANQALENYRNSQKKEYELSYERAVVERYEAFKSELEAELSDGKKINLTKAVDIVDFDEDSFLYIGHTWQGQEHRMHHKDILNAYLAENKNRKDITKNMNLSGSARQHASYYIVILQKFCDFIEEKPIKTNGDTLEEEKLKCYIMVIDEINRANLSSVLGELIYALEYRGKGIEGMYSKTESDKIILPPNLYIIGTMNTADRSVGHIDYAIRRRFAFVDVLPTCLDGEDFDEILFNAVKELFTTDEYVTRSSFLSSEFDPKDVALGHSYFIKQYEKDAEGNDDKSRPYDFALRLEYEIKPILREYIKDGILIGKGIEQKVEELKATI